MGNEIFFISSKIATVSSPFQTSCQEDFHPLASPWTGDDAMATGNK